ncbi:MAG: hypothetical protein HDT37_07990 [Clostridiales bacterium]|nr:hypothetical protein [Clostridiales bacterium]
MIWKRLKRYASEQEEKHGPEETEDLHVTFRERLVMVLTAYVVIVLPCALVLIGLCLLISWLFGLL